MKSHSPHPFIRLCILLTLIVGSSVWWYFYNLQPVSATKTPETLFVVPKGQPTKTILSRLEEAKLIRSATVMNVYVYLSKQQGTFQAGSFRLSSSMVPTQIIDELQHGTIDTWVTIPEGWRAEQIVDELVSDGLLANIPLKELYQEFAKHEGYLFPDTYLFAHDSTTDQTIKKFTDNFSQKTSNIQLSPSNVILASLIEREAKLAADRPLIASVLTNRLKIGMPLQVDASIQYALANSKDWWPSILLANRKVASPYNTYFHAGLPPAPIANPGISAIQAAVNPSKTDYLYYVSEANGTTHYAKTLGEHNANIAKYLR